MAQRGGENGNGREMLLIIEINTVLRCTKTKKRIRVCGNARVQYNKKINAGPHEKHRNPQEFFFFKRQYSKRRFLSYHYIIIILKLLEIREATG